MKEICILVPESSVLQTVSGPQYLFSAINQFMEMAGKKPLFHITLVGTKKQVNFNGGMYSVRTDRLIHEKYKADLIIIPALFGDMKMAIEKNKKLIPWIVDQHQNGAEIASLCVGAFLLASSGLLDGKKCSTHWGFQNEFRAMFPNVEIVSGSIITEEHHLYSSGGANSFWNLLLHLVEKYANREVAILAAKYFALDIDRDSQNAFAIFQGQKSHIDDDVKKVQEYIEDNIDNKITVDELAKMISVGRRSFERRFRDATHNSVLEYIQRVKIEAAKKRLENSRLTITEVMYQVGYTDTKAFRTIFKKVTGLTPAEYKGKYSRLTSTSRQT